MTLEYFRDYQELFDKCVLWFTGQDSTLLAFPILPTGVTVTPYNSFGTPLNLGDNKSLIRFNSSGYISLTDNNAWYVGSSDYTWCCWAYATSVSYTKQFLMQYADSSNIAHYFGYNPDHGLNYGLKTGGSWKLDLYKSGDDGSYPANKWHFLAVTKNGSLHTIYKNTVIKASATYSTAHPDNTGPLNIGYNAAGTTYYWNGYIKDLLLYKGRALTVAELALIMKLTNPASGYDIRPILPGIRGVE